MKSYVQILGKSTRDRVTGAVGIAASVSFDLYGCVQVYVDRGFKKDGDERLGAWFDFARLEVIDENRVMPLPAFAPAPAKDPKGPAEKPKP